jgi:hydroxymethylbilane synthase
LAGELETALAAGEVDLVTCSLRDLPPSDAAELEIAAILPRGDVTESLVSADNVRLAGLPPGSVVGVTNQRRAAQVRVLRPDLETMIVNGSVEDRIRKVRAGDLDAVVLATASLRRLAVLYEACETFSFDDFLPAAGQGVIAVQVRRGDRLAGLVREALDDAATRQATVAEREFVRPFEQSDEWQAVAYAVLNGDLNLRARLVSSDGHKHCEVIMTGTDPHEIAAQAVRRIEDQLATMRE